MSETGFQMQVFRDGRRAVAGPALGAALASDLRALAATTDAAAYRERALSALLRAGELECALADLGDLHRLDAALVAQCTDALAAALVAAPAAPNTTPDATPDATPNTTPDATPNATPDATPAAHMLDALARAALPARVMVTRPEGFAYYAVHPLDFAAATDALALGARPVFVVGLRSIGTTLSAVVAAAARRHAPAERITVRPTGHPYDRRLALTNQERTWVARGVGREAAFVVVDEGPGLSGSSLLAVAEALADAGVPCARITILCSHVPDTGALLARDAARRYARFRVQARIAARPFPDGASFVGGGAWRGEVYGDAAAWPASWISMERLKYRREGRLLKFEGLGPYGEEVAARARALAEAGLGPALHGAGDGFVSYEWVGGRPLGADDLTPDVLVHMAGYCAFRARAFPAVAGDELAAMARANHAAEFGGELAGDLTRALGRELRLPCPYPVIADGRMLPHEWVRADGGRLVKIDGVAHGDDHFLPGPTDIAWDLAGIIVEWNLASEARARLLGAYLARSGDDARERIDDYVLAYTLFRLGYVKMAAGALRGSDEEPRLLRAHQRYRSALLHGSRSDP
jgi:hypothetical protein